MRIEEELQRLDAAGPLSDEVVGIINDIIEARGWRGLLDDIARVSARRDGANGRILGGVLALRQWLYGA